MAEKDISNSTRADIPEQSDIRPAQPETLLEYLLDNPVDGVSEHVYPSERFKQLGFAFKITAMSGDQFSDYQQRATAVAKKRGASVKFNSKLFNELVVLNHTVEPNFKNAESIQRAGCATPEQFMYKVLKAGEVINLSNLVSELSGFDSDTEGLVADVKNS